MSDWIMARLDALRERVEKATPGPWESYGDGDHEVYQAAEYDDGDLGPYIAWSVPAKGDAVFIAAARTDVPCMETALRAVLELHRAVTVYADETECPNSGDQTHVNDWHEESVTIGGKWYCAQMPLYRACAHCLDEDGEQSDWPCETRRAVADALGLEGDDSE
ncbi:hypothetical protein [Brevibacterium otitidis]|uniref:Uncharacterized protein n=1 Tax=Brevibacterium otitidis TaxID=53364 RepID=A0ABV5X4R6_9MICO|nr:hypothetical protein GCM10023233_22840 [Brevibacterium otitidis]